MDRAGQDIDGTETTAACKARLGKTFSDVTICKFKLRKLVTSYRCNATEASAWVYYMPTVISHCIHSGFISLLNDIISLGVGWLALLIFTKGQCEGLNLGISAEEQTPTSFLYPQLYMNRRSWGVVGTDQ